jgi:S1-C subfamily serine protease
VTSLLVVAAVVAAGLRRAGDSPLSTTGPATAPEVDAIDGSRRNAIVNAAERASPAVVAVGTVEQRYIAYFDWRRGLAVDPVPEVYELPFLGSGVVIDGDEGLIVTNDHVVRGLRTLLVTLPDGRRFEARLIGSDPNNDLALLRVEADDLPEVPLGRSEGLMIGEWAIAIGNPFGNLIDNPQPTVTVGVISALNRSIPSGPGRRAYVRMIQTDAGINPGNSGGALVNARGELVGVNTFIISPSGSSADIAFAIPVDRVRLILEDLRQRGQVRPIYRDYHARTHEPWLGELIGEPFHPGAIVYEIDVRGPAAAAGLRNGDVITEINGLAVAGAEELEHYLFISRVGEPIKLKVWRPDGEHTVEYELVAERP